MKQIFLAALFTCIAASGADMRPADHHILLAAASGKDKVLLNHIIESTEKKLHNQFSTVNLSDYKLTTVVFQDKPVVQVVYFKSAAEKGFLFEYRIENGQAKLVSEINEIVADPEIGVAQPGAAAKPAKKETK